MTHERYRTIKVRQATYRRLKLLAAEQDVTLVDLIDRVVRQFSDTSSDTGAKDEDAQNDTDQASAALGQAKPDTMRA